MPGKKKLKKLSKNIEVEVDEEEQEEQEEESKLEKQNRILKEELTIENMKTRLESNREFRYYLLNNLLNINESLKKIGLVLIRIGKSMENENSDEEEEEVDEE